MLDISQADDMKATTYTPLGSKSNETGNTWLTSAIPSATIHYQNIPPGKSKTESTLSSGSWLAPGMDQLPSGRPDDLNLAFQWSVQTQSQQGQNVQAPSASTLTHQQLSQPSQSQPQPSMSLPLQSTQQLPGSSLLQQIPSEHQLNQNQSASSQPTPSPLLFQQLTQNPSYSEHQQQFSFSSYQAQKETGNYEENEEVDVDDDEEDEDDAEYMIFDGRATLSSFENGAWKKQGVGSLRVSYEDDTSGFMVTFQGDDNVLKCRHIICRENKITQHQKNCEWRPLNFVTDKPVRSHFVASFSSAAAAEEFAGTFRQGQKNARESEISEVVSSVMDTPIIFSSGESGTKG